MWNLPPSLEGRSGYSCLLFSYFSTHGLSWESEDRRGNACYKPWNTIQWRNDRSSLLQLLSHLLKRPDQLKKRVFWCKARTRAKEKRRERVGLAGAGQGAEERRGGEAGEKGGGERSGGPFSIRGRPKIYWPNWIPRLTQTHIQLPRRQHQCSLLRVFYLKSMPFILVFVCCSQHVGFQVSDQDQTHIPCFRSSRVSATRPPGKSHIPHF